MIIFKRITVALVLLFAVFGAFMLFKKAPQLHIPEEDKKIIEEIFGGTEFNHSGEAEKSGLSSLMNHGVEGAPSISSSLSGASNAPPGSFGSSTAPAFLSARSSEAPSFGAPAFETATSEAPAFPVDLNVLPGLNNNPVVAETAPLYGAQYTAPIARQPLQQPEEETTVAPPFGDPVAVPVQDPFAPSNLFDIPSATPTTPDPTPVNPPQSEAPPFSAMPIHASPFDTPPLETSPPAQTLPEPIAATQPVPPDPDWNGPTTAMAITTSADFNESSEVFGVSEQNVVLHQNVPQPQIAPFAPTQSEPFTATDFSSTQVSPTQINPAQMTATQCSLLRSEKASYSAEPYHLAEQKTLEQSTRFVKPQPKRLPMVDERYAQVVVLPKTPEPIRPEQSAERNADQIVPGEYQQTSIRDPMVFAPARKSVPDEAPKISFGQHSSKTAANTTSVGTLVVDPEIVPTETRPFIADAVRTESLEQPAAATSFWSQATSEVITETSVVSLPARNQNIEQVNPITARPEPSVSPVVASTIRDTVSRFIESQHRAYQSGDSARMRNAYVQLSRLYDHKELNDVERAYLTPILDRMGLDIIFSCRQHVLESAYIVKAEDTVDSIADAYKISPALLMKINGLTGARPLKPGMELKVVFGQFDARISASKSELTLILGGLYAGRFLVDIGSDIKNLRGDFVVNSKIDSARGRILVLNNDVTLRTDDSTAKAFRFSERDANELFDILTEHSVISLED